MPSRSTTTERVMPPPSPIYSPVPSTSTTAPGMREELGTERTIVDRFMPPAARVGTIGWEPKAKEVRRRTMSVSSS
jgi:hypothetical protein